MSNIILMSKPYRDERALETVINYCSNPEKIIGFYARGVNSTSTETIVDDMKFMKKYLGKEDGKQLCHFIMTIDSPYYDRETIIKACKEIVMMTCDYWNSEGYQICAFIHKSTKNSPKRVHAHFVVNAVNLITGKRLSDATERLYKMHRDLANVTEKLCWNGVLFNYGKENDEEEIDYL